MIGPVHTTYLYPRPVDGSNDEPAPTRKKRSLDTASHAEPNSAAVNDRTRRRTGGGMDSLGRGNIL